jgi:hypothetical protein
MEKGMCLGSIGVAGFLLLLFLLDLFADFPFGGSAYTNVDVFGILACAIILYLGWNAYKDLK